MKEALVKKVGRYKTSRYNTIAEIDSDNLLIFNSLSRAFSRMNKDEFDALTSFDEPLKVAPDNESSPLIDQLLINNFLVPSDVDELEKFRKYYFSHRTREDNLGLTILPTINCNFACAYCFEGSDKPKEFMPEKIQKAIMNLLRQKEGNLKSLNVTWFGGEPLLGIDVIKRLSNEIVPYCDCHGISFYASIITNGYMLSEEIVAELYLRRVRTIQITLDGPEHLHDTSRFLKNGGKGTYQTILKNIENYIEKYPIHTILRINTDETNIAMIYELLEDLYERGLAKTKRLSVYFSPIEASSAACGKSVDDLLSMETFAKHEYELYKYAVERELCKAALPYHLVGICTATRPNGLVILPNGDIHRCWETVNRKDLKAGDINNGDDITKNDIDKQWRGWSPFENKECCTCSLLPSCGGYCAYRSLYKQEFTKKPSMCPALKYTVKEKLLYFAAKTDAEVAQLLLLQDIKL
jgi:uncharacterized protein